MTDRMTVGDVTDVVDVADDFHLEHAAEVGALAELPVGLVSRLRHKLLLTPRRVAASLVASGVLVFGGCALASTTMNQVVPNRTLQTVALIGAGLSIVAALAWCVMGIPAVVARRDLTRVVRRRLRLRRPGGMRSRNAGGRRRY